MDFSAYLEGGLEGLFISTLGDVYRRCEQSNKFSLADSLSCLCRNINRKAPKTPTAKIALGKLMAILSNNENAMVDLAKMAKDVSTSLSNAKTVLKDISQVCSLYEFF